MLVFLLLNALVLWIFIRTPKKLTPYEILGGWLVTVLFHDDWLTIVSINMNLILTSKNHWIGLVISINRILLYPALLVLFMEWYVRTESLGKRVALYIGSIAGLLFLEYLNDWLYFYDHKRWPLWASIITWSVLLVIVILTNRLFKSLLKRAELE